MLRKFSPTSVMLVEGRVEELGWIQLALFYFKILKQFCKVFEPLGEDAEGVKKVIIYIFKYMYGISDF